MILGDSLFFLHVNARNGDTGSYYCLARNEVGRAKSNNATLDVASPLKLSEKQNISKTSLIDLVNLKVAVVVQGPVDL
ncbi:hypothetical protein BLA29_008411 [Euroglyphus maynei]|uniref:Immunoglobulin I-set domain-containing protein n=1 Tax=Euroglyphus maynei TaxID=6958 RepID=A0A1Y3BWV5_EURMA|nr:hypothetical protein BLA29_008411 [Euroglyphus maynei]